jgi:hypothetical protein
MRNVRCIHSFSEGNRRDKPNRRHEIGIETQLKEIRHEIMTWIQFVQEMIHCRTLGSVKRNEFSDLFRECSFHKSGSTSWSWFFRASNEHYYYYYYYYYYLRTKKLFCCGDCYSPRIH